MTAQVLSIPAKRLFSLFDGHSLGGLSGDSIVLGGVIAAFVCVLVLWVAFSCRKDLRASWLLMLLGFFMFYLFVPFQVHVRWVPERTSIYLLAIAVVVVGWTLGARSEAVSCNFVQKKVGRMALVVVVPIMLLDLGIHLRDHVEINRYYREYLSAAEKIEPNSTVLALRVVGAMPDDIGYSTLHKLLQGGSYFVPLCGAVDVKNFQAQTRVVPIRYRENKNPYRYWLVDRDLVSAVPSIDLQGLERYSGQKLDYVLIWGSLDLTAQPAAIREELKRLLGALEQHFDLVLNSEGYGYMRLYKRTNMDS
jgi:hypothetical protein